MSATQPIMAHELLGTWKLVRAIRTIVETDGIIDEQMSGYNTYGGDGRMQFCCFEVTGRRPVMFSRSRMIRGSII